MAVPSAVLRQRERLEAELGVKADGSPLTPSTPADPTLTLVPPAVPESTPPSQPQTTAPPDADTAAARIAELEHLLKTRDGQTSASMREANEAKNRADMLATQVRALEEAVAEITKQKDTAESLATARRADADMPSMDDDVGELSPTELEKFGADSVDFVKKLSKRELLAYIKPLVTKVGAMEKSLARLSDLDRLPQLEQVVKSSQEESNRLKEEEFFRSEVLAYFPDFETMRETQEWKDYLTTDIPGRGIKNGHLLHQYRLAHNAPGIRSLLQGYYDQSKTKPSLAALAVPGKTQTEGTPVVKPKLKASEYKAQLKLFVQKKLKQADWDAFKTEFETALNEGRVDMDERL
jgi:hypothetical protein